MAVSVKLEECGDYPIEFVLMRSVMKVLLWLILAARYRNPWVWSEIHIIC